MQISQSLPPLRRSTQSTALMPVDCAATRNGRGGSAEGDKRSMRREAPNVGQSEDQVGARCAEREDMSTTWRASRVEGEQVSLRQLVRRGIEARIAEFIEVSMVAFGVGVL